MTASAEAFTNGCCKLGEVVCIDHYARHSLREVGRNLNSRWRNLEKVTTRDQALVDMEYDLVVCTDAYAAVHFVMPLIFHDFHEWKKAAMTRNDVPEEIFGELTEDRLRYDHKLIDFIRNQGFGYSSEVFVTFLIENWQYEPGDALLSCNASHHA